MSKMQNRIDLPAQINACERILAFDDARLNLELRKAGLDPEALAHRLERTLNISTPIVSAAGGEHDARRAQLQNPDRPPPPRLAACNPDPQSGASASAPPRVADALEIAGRIKFFDARRGFGFIVADGELGDVLVHILHLREAGYSTAHEGARVHAMARATEKGLQVTRIISMDESSAIHPSLLPQGTREKVQPESDWVTATVKWYNREKGYGFVCEVGGPDCLVHADTLQRWGVAPLVPKQVVEIRWGMTPKGRMVAEIRYLHGASALPPIH